MIAPNPLKMSSHPGILFSAYRNKTTKQLLCFLWPEFPPMVSTIKK